MLTIGFSFYKEERANVPKLHRWGGIFAKKSGLNIDVLFSKTRIEDRPTRIDFSLGANIRYTYSAGGGLQTVTYHSTVNGTPTKTLQYVGELVFENGVLTDINHEYGRVLANNGFFNFNLHC